MKPYIVISGTINKCISKTQTRHTGVYSTGGRLLPYDLHFYKALLKLMLSSKRYVTLRLSFCEIFARSNGQNFGLGDPGPGGTGNAPKRTEDLSGTDMYHHAKFHADLTHHH